MGFQSAFGNVGVLLVFLTSAPLYLAVGWRATFIVFAIWTLADVVLTFTFLRGRHSAASDDPQTSSISKPRTRRTIPLFFVLAAFISGGTYAVILNFANIFLGTRAHLDVSQANLIVSSFIAFASLGAIATGGSTRFVPTNVLLAISYVVCRLLLEKHSRASDGRRSRRREQLQACNRSLANRSRRIGWL